MMMVTAAPRADPFTALNRVLDSPHAAVGTIRRACFAVEECLVNNRWDYRGILHYLL